MKMRSSVLAMIAAMSVTALAAAFATTTVPIESNHSRADLESICDAVDGKSYGSAGKAYGCSRGTVTVECLRDGSCTGYVYFRMASSGPSTNDAAALLQHRSATRTVTVGAAGDY